ncbi:MAG: threonylcarbamoyl-AMP synthase [Euryarchaeota archaeon]|nr:threonylcarbamoyl-AMP synthase [Euryarchaeota archaeon]
MPEKVANETIIVDGGEATAIARAAVIVKKGGLVAFPTETVYGLGADATNPLAVAKVFEVKARPRFDPLIVHVAKTQDVRQLVQAFDKRAQSLAAEFWPGPLTLVLPKRDLIPDIVTAGLAAVAVRVPAHDVARSLIEAAGVPIAAPSANPFGYVSPTTARHVADQLDGKVPLILDGGPTMVGIESTVLSLVGETPLLLRPGGIPIEALEAVIGRVDVAEVDAGESLSPGSGRTHYSPHVPFRLVTSWRDRQPEHPKRVGLLAFKAGAFEGFEAVEVLSSTGELDEAAANLFAAMRRLDEARLDLILAEAVPERGIGVAIMDRLRRAAAKA